MRAGVLSLALAASCVVCGGPETIQDAKQTKPAAAELAFADTIAPQIKPEEQVKWLAFLIDHLVDRYPGSKNSTDYEIALLLEVSRHEEEVLLDAIVRFKELRRKDEVHLYGWYFEVRDTMALIRNTKLAMPHYETPGYGPRMWPLTIENGQISYAGLWPPTREGLWPYPFESVEFIDYSEPDAPRKFKSTHFALEKKQFGERDLDEFKEQFLSAEKRAELWNRFVNNES